MKKRLYKQILSGVLGIALVGSLCLPQGGMNEPSVALAADSNYSFASSSSQIPENAKTVKVSVSRTGSAANEETVIVNAYDISADYGKDYILSFNGNTAEVIENSISMFRSFKENSVEVMREAEAASLIGSNGAVASDSDENGFAALDDIDAKAAALPIRFEEGEEKTEINLQIINDSISEYDEAFILNIVKKDTSGKERITGNCTFSISDDEENVASNIIEITSDSIKLESGQETAKVYFKRTGNLATISKAVLYKEEKAYGYVSFVPYQEIQYAKLPKGQYNLISEGTALVTQKSITISEAEQNDVSGKSEKQKKKEQKKKLDNLALDDIPQYASYDEEDNATGGDILNSSGKKTTKSAVPLKKKSKKVQDSNDWYPDWAKEGKSYEDKNCKVVMGSGSSIFKFGGHSNNGALDYYPGTNMLRLNTEGGDSAYTKSHVYADCNKKEDLTGYESIESKFVIDDLNRDAKVKMGVYKLSCQEDEYEGKGEHNIKLNIADKTQHYNYVYYENIDFNDWDDGCKVYFPNGYKMNKRKYLFQIDDSAAVSFVDSSGMPYKKSYSAGSGFRQFVTMNNDTKVQVNLDYNEAYPVTLVGYRFKNSAGESGIVKISSDHNITFDQSFLKTNEKGWSFKTSIDDKEYNAFRIVPVVDKIKVNYIIDASDGGELTLENTDKTLYKGDYALFSGKGAKEGWKFEAVDVYAKKAGENVWDKCSYSAVPGTSVKVKLSDEYDDYRFQGVFTSDVNQITIKRGETYGSHGTYFAGEDGVVVTKNQYVVNGYATLTAEPEKGYVTRWTSNGRVYYGNTLYYQMDGNIKNDSFVVDFLPENKCNITTRKLSGTIFLEEVNLFDSSMNALTGLSEKQYSIVSDKLYDGKTDESGRFSIENFTGVEGGTYTAAVQLGNEFGYLRFTYNPDPDDSSKSENLTLKVGQFSNMAFYPYKIKAAVNNANSNRPDITLDNEAKVTFNVTMKKTTPDCEIDKVILHFYRLNNDGEKVQEVSQVEAAEIQADETNKDTFNNHVSYEVTVGTDKLESDTYVYVDAYGKKKVYYTDDKGKETGEMTVVYTGEADTGYRLKTQLEDKTLPEHQDIPYMGGLQEAKSVDWSKLNLDFLGCLDLSVSGKGGGYFVSQKAGDNTYYLVAGFNITSFWAKSVTDNYAAARDTRAKLKEMEENGQKLGSTGKTASNITSDTEGQEKGEKTTNGVKPKIMVAPTFMIRFTVRAYFDENNVQHMYIAAFDLAIGVDERVVLNMPFNVYGVPFYVNITFSGEQFGRWEVAFKNDKDHELGKENIDAVCRISDSDGSNNQRVYIELSDMTLTVKGGIGFNNFVGAYLQASVNPTVLAESDHGLDAGGNITGSIGAGADLAIFNLNVDLKLGTSFGNQKLADEINKLTSNNALKSVRTMNNGLLKGVSLAETDGSVADITAKMNQSTFGILPRSNKKLLKTSVYNPNTLITPTFRGTNVKLVNLGGDRIMAVSLMDNGAGEESYNFLSAVTVISEDGGKTWKDAQKISESDNIQFFVNPYVVGDKILVTWSEGNMDALLEKNDAGKAELKASDVGKALNGFDLKGCFYNMDGSKAGEAFDIVADENTSASMLQAYEKDGLIYAYYQRCKYSEETDVQNTELISQDRTISYVTIDPEHDNKVTLSDSQIIARNKDGSSAYRITEIVPVSFKGIIGDVLVIDRDGRFLNNDGNGNVEPSIDDRQIFLRINDDSKGSLKEGTLIPLTDIDSNAQNIHVEMKDDHIYLFYNHSGEIKVLKDFVMTKKEHDKEVNKEKAVIAVVDTDTGEVEVSDDDEAYSAKTISGETSSITSATEIDTSMDENGNILLTWIGADEAETDNNSESDSKNETASHDELYGMLLKESDENGSLEANGSPVALTDKNKTLRHADSLCLGDGDYLLVYTILDGETVYNSTTADVVSEKVKCEPDIEITDVKVPEYPIAGEEAVMKVKVKNNGLVSAKGLVITTEGIDSRQTADVDDDVWNGTDLEPGEEREADVILNIPENMNSDISFNVKAEASGSSDEKEGLSVKYGTYFVPVEIPSLSNVANTKNFHMSLLVKNKGNKSGVPEISYRDSVVGSMEDDANKDGKISLDTKEIIAPGEERTVNGVITDSLADNASLVSLAVILGDRVDQSIECVYPVLRTVQDNVQAPDITPPPVPTNNPAATENPVPAKNTASKTDGGHIYGLAKGMTFRSGYFKYKVTAASTDGKNGRVCVAGLSKKGKKSSVLSIGSFVKLSSSATYKAAKYKVTGIGKNAFKNAKAKKISLNKNIVIIPAKAFKGCKKLKHLVIKGQLRRVEKNAFDRSKKKITISGAKKKINKKNVKLLNRVFDKQKRRFIGR